MCKSRSYIDDEPNVTVDVLTGPNIKDQMSRTFWHGPNVSVDVLKGLNVRSSTEDIIYLSKLTLKEKQSQTLFKAMKTDFL